MTFRVSAGLLLVLCCAVFAVVPGKRVLILNSYNPGYLWSDLEMQGMDSVLKTRPAIEVHFEYMDAKFVEDSAQTENLRRLFAHKYGRVRLDVILASDNNALDFLCRYRGDIFPGVPVVFCGINDYHDSMLAGQNAMTGVVENLDYRSTITLVPQLWPQAKELVIINDSSMTGLAHDAQVRAVEYGFTPHLRFRYLQFSTMTLDELQQELVSLPPNCAVLYLSSFKSRDRNYSLQESMRRIVESSPVPVFAVNDSRVFLGAMGGCVVSGFSQGAVAAGMALKILDNVPASQIPVLKKSPNRYMFSYSALTKYGIPLARLPGGYVLIDPPMPLHEKYRTIISGLVIVIAILILSSAGYYYSSRKRRAAELALLESEKGYHELFENLNDAVTVSELHADGRPGRFIEINEVFCQWLGYSCAEIRQMTLFDIGDDITAESYREFVHKLVKTGSGRAERRLRTKSGSIIPVEANIRLIRHRGRPAILSIVRDITSRKAFEETLAAEKERLHVTLHSIAEGVIATDDRGRIILMNPVAEALTGWAEEEARGRALNEVFQTLRKGDIPGLANIRTTLVSRHGIARLISDSLAPICNREGRVLGEVLVFRDITEQTRMEEGLQNSARLESLGVLAGGIAHDFNNLLGGIFGYMDLARQAAEKKDFEKTVASLSKGLSVYERTRDLTRQLLTFSKGGSPVLRVAELPLFIREAVQFVMSGSHLECVLEVPDALWPCEIDPGQITQVIHNLVINAQQAMPENGCISVVARNLPEAAPRPLTLAPGPCVLLAVTDTGQGISTALQAKIFDPFFTTKQKGSGLGLAIVHSILQKHRGAIEVESLPGKGTTFRVYLPALPGALPEPRPAG